MHAFYSSGAHAQFIAPAQLLFHNFSVIPKPLQIKIVIKAHETYLVKDSDSHPVFMQQYSVVFLSSPIFHVSSKIIHKNQLTYMVHTSFLTFSQTFNPLKISTYTLTLACVNSQAQVNSCIIIIISAGNKMPHCYCKVRAKTGTIINK